MATHSTQSVILDDEAFTSEVSICHGDNSTTKDEVKSHMIHMRIEKCITGC